MMKEKKNKKLKTWQIVLIVVGALILIGAIFGGTKSSDDSIPEAEDVIEDLPKILVSNTEKGITLILEDYKTEKINENRTKITELTFTLLNEGSRTIYPDLFLTISDIRDPSFPVGTIPKYSRYNIPLTEVLYEGEYIHKIVPLDADVWRPEILKDVTLSASDSVSYENPHLVSVELKNIDFSFD